MMNETVRTKLKEHIASISAQLHAWCKVRKYSMTDLRQMFPTCASQEVLFAVYNGEWLPPETRLYDVAEMLAKFEGADDANPEA